MYEIGIVNGRVYLGKEFKVMNVYIKDGKFAEITKEKRACEREIDATKKMVLPGFIDGHVHLSYQDGEFISADDFESGSKTAAYGGVTTFMDFLEPISHEDQFKEAFNKRMKMGEMSAIDYGFHGTVGNFTGDTDKLKKMCKSSGITSIKVYTTYSELDRKCPDDVIYQLLDPEMMVLAHCEEEAMLKRRWLAPSTYEKSRPAMAERSAALHLAGLAEKKEGNLYIAHVSAGSTLDMIKLKFPGLIGKKIFLESCPHYFYLSDVKLNNNDGNLYLTNPPLRDGKELMRLRRSFHLVDTIASDHCPFMIEDKMKYEKAYQVPKGLDGLEYTFPLMFNLFGDQVISKYTSKPAELFGLKNKGEIRVGKDGDAVIFDNTLSNTIRESHSKSDYTVYEGLKIRGKITTTISRGQVIMSDDVYYGGKGQYLRRG